MSPSLFFDRYHAEAPLQAAILARLPADLWPWWVVGRWLRTLSPRVRFQRGEELHRLRFDAVAAVDEGEVVQIERGGCLVVPAAWSPMIAPHCPRLTGQRVPRLDLDGEGEE